VTAFNRQESWGSLEEYARTLDGGVLKTSSYALVESGIKTITASGDETPNYHKLRLQGKLLPLNRYSNVEESCEGSLYWESSRNSDGDIHYVNQRWRPDHLEYQLPVNTEALVQAAAARVYASGHDTLTFLSELSKTRKMVFELPGKIRQLIRKEGLRSWRDVSNIWLEGRMGWRPLIYDLEDIRGAVTALAENKRERVSERVGTSIYLEVESNREIPFYFPGSVQMGYITVYTTTKVEGSVRAQVVADFLPPSFQFNPAVTAWELVPFSFIIDWIIGVGTALEAISLAVVAPRRFASYGYQLLVTTEQEVVSARALTGRILRSCSGQGKRTTLLKTRTPTSIPYLPQINVKMDNYKVADLLAILNNVSRRK